MNYYVFCKTCKKRQRLESLEDNILAKFIRFHNTHNIFIDTVEKMGYDILAYSDQWIGKKPEFDNINVHTLISTITDELRREIAELTSKNRELELALYDIKASIAPTPEERAALSSGYKDLLKEVVKDGNRIARNERIPLDEDQIKEIGRAANERINRLPKEVRGSISEVVEE